jgi:transcription initiation factor IIE alpha subunit
MLLQELALVTYKTQAADEKRREVEHIYKEKQQALRQLEAKMSEQITALQSQITVRFFHDQSIMLH